MSLDIFSFVIFNFNHEIDLLQRESVNHIKISFFRLLMPFILILLEGKLKCHTHVDIKYVINCVPPKLFNMCVAIRYNSFLSQIYTKQNTSFFFP